MARTLIVGRDVTGIADDGIREALELLVVTTTLGHGSPGHSPVDLGAALARAPDLAVSLAVAGRAAPVSSAHHRVQ